VLTQDGAEVELVVDAAVVIGAEAPVLEATVEAGVVDVAETALAAEKRLKEGVV
jgi:hypothetical protein